MIPVLYGADETAFTSNGLGRLSEAITCKVVESRNGAYELEMQYPITGKRYADLLHSRFIFAKPSDDQDPQPFRIYSISKPINGMCTYYARHIRYQMGYIPLMPTSQTYLSASAFFADISSLAAESCPFSFSTDVTTSGTLTQTEPVTLMSKLGGTQGSVLDVFGGEYEFDGYDVHLWHQRGADRGVTLRYGKNITDISQEENIENTVTGVLPYWKGTVDNSEVVVTLTEKVLHSSNAGNFPFHRTVMLDLSSEFQSQPTEDQLRAKAQTYITQTGIGVPKVNIKVVFLPLWQSEEYKNIARNFEHVGLCDTVTVDFPKLGISAQSKVVKTDYDVLRERYNEIELGDARTNFSDSIRADIQSAIEANKNAIAQANSDVKSVLRQEMEDAIGRIQLGDDGYIVFDYDESTNRRTQILAMDTEDISTATEILQINHAGIGGYSNGIDDSSGYTLAITTDGKINAGAINTGTLLAALIVASTLTVGGTTSGDGSIYVKNASGTTIISLNKNGYILRNTDGNPVIGMSETGFKLYNGQGTGTRLAVLDENGVEVFKGAISGSTFDVKGNGKINLYNSSNVLIGYIDSEGFKSEGTSGSWINTYHDLALLYGSGLDLGPDRRIFFSPDPDASSANLKGRRAIICDRTGLRLYVSTEFAYGDENITEVGGLVFNNIEDETGLADYVSTVTLWGDTLRLQARTLRVVAYETSSSELTPSWHTYNAVSQDVTVDGKTLKFRNGILVGVT